VNSFPAAAPFAQMHGKSPAFHQAQIELCASLLSLLLAGRTEQIGGCSEDQAEHVGKWRVVAE
jgi:hypothetical protein